MYKLHIHLFITFNFFMYTFCTCTQKIECSFWLEETQYNNKKYSINVIINVIIHIIAT